VLLFIEIDLIADSEGKVANKYPEFLETSSILFKSIPECTSLS